MAVFYFIFSVENLDQIVVTQQPLKKYKHTLKIVNFWVILKNSRAHLYVAQKSLEGSERLNKTYWMF